MKRSFGFWLYFGLAIVLAVYFSVRIIMVFLGHGNVARIRNISISADVPDKDLSALAAAAATAPGAHTYSVSLDEVNTRVATVPGVYKSAVRRMPNGNLAVRVKLYRAVALWSDGENFFPLSADGTIVQRPSDARAEGTILFRGNVPNDITEITNAAHGLINDVDYLEWIEGRRWNLYTSSGITVMLPEENPTAAIGALGIMNKNHQILSKKLDVIDMRDPARILVK